MNNYKNLSMAELRVYRAALASKSANFNPRIRQQVSIRILPESRNFQQICTDRLGVLMHLDPNPLAITNILIAILNSSARKPEFRNSKFSQFSRIPGQFDRDISMADDKKSAGSRISSARNPESRCFYIRTLTILQ